MARCANCGIEIPSSDKTKLCDRCKNILLPFVKIVNASTSSAVRRLVSNERNLRNAGVTDRGMDYLLRLCELHDAERARIKAEADAARAAAEAEAAVAEESSLPEEKYDKYTEIELPADEPLKLSKKPYGSLIGFVAVICLFAAAGFAALLVLGYVRSRAIEWGYAIGAVSSLYGAYLARCMRKIKKELDEIKRQFR